MSRVFFVFKKLLLWVEDGERKKFGVQNANANAMKEDYGCERV